VTDQTALNFELISPEAKLYGGTLALAVLPAYNGEIGVGVRHESLVAALRPGIIRLYETEGIVAEEFYIAGGFADISEAGCTVLAEDSEKLSEMSEPEIDKLIDRLQKTIESRSDAEEVKYLQIDIKALENKKRALKNIAVFADS